MTIYQIDSAELFDPELTTEWLVAGHNPKSQIRNPKSLLVVIPVGQKTIEKCYANQRCHNDYIGNAFGVQHIILKGVDGFHK